MNFHEAGLSIGVVGMHVTALDATDSSDDESLWAGSRLLRYVSRISNEREAVSSRLSEWIVRLGFGAARRVGF